jgi:cyclic-di-GMP phosphodiesterase TipF (flagellum assembly factor)
LRGLVYLFIAVASLSVGLMAYFGLSFTPIEAGLLVLIAGLGCLLVLELSLRRRAEIRLEKAIEDLTRVHARDAVASQEIGNKLDSLIKREIATRVDVIEADVSVLGTVIRQVAESVADLEDRMAKRPPAAPQPAATSSIPEFEAASAPSAAPAPAPLHDPVVPEALVAQAVDEGRLSFHLQPIVTLPQRKLYAYDLVPRLMMEDGELADPPDFMPRQPGSRTMMRIERLILDTAITIARRSRTGGKPATLFLPLSATSLDDFLAREQMLAALEANRAIAKHLIFSIEESEFNMLASSARDTLEAIAGKGVGICIDEARSLRLDFADMTRLGVGHVKVDADLFIGAPHLLSDIHSSDVVAYLARSGVAFIARDVENEAQILSLLDESVKFAQGPHIAPPSPIRADLLGHGEAPELKRALG